MTSEASSSKSDTGEMLANNHVLCGLEQLRSFRAKQDTVLDPHLYLPCWRQVDPHATIVELDQAGHAVQEDQPEQVSQALLQFLAS